MRTLKLMRVTLVLALLGLMIDIQRTNASDPIDAMIQAMSLDQRVGQLFTVVIPGDTMTPEIENFLRQMLPGGIAMFSTNVGTPDRVTQTINTWQSVAVQIGAHIPLFIAIDHEGGAVTRLTPALGFTGLPWGAALGAMPAASAQLVGAMAGEELRAVGINLNFGPVVDVRAKPPADKKPYFVESRTFSSDPMIVGNAASAYIQGLHSQGMIATLKHFPGHGAAGDSHIFLPAVEHDRTQIEQIDLPPFIAGIKAGADAVMVAHVHVDALDPTPNMPASLSSKIITDLLRNQLGFTGVVMTDALDMKAVIDNFTLPRATVMAFLAGNDLLTAGPSFSLSDQIAMKAAIMTAVNKGEISEARLNESVGRILRLKAKYNLLEWRILDPLTAVKRTNATAHQEALDRLYLDTVAIGYDFAEMIPLNGATQKIGFAYPRTLSILKQSCGAISPLENALAYNVTPSSEDVDAIGKMAEIDDVVVIFTLNIDQNPLQSTLVGAVPGKKTIVVALQNPYDFERGIGPAAYIAAFNPVPSAFRAVCAILYGKATPVGNFPVVVG